MDHAVAILVLDQISVEIELAALSRFVAIAVAIAVTLAVVAEETVIERWLVLRPRADLGGIEQVAEFPFERRRGKRVFRRIVALGLPLRGRVDVAQGIDTQRVPTELVVEQLGDVPVRVNLLDDTAGLVEVEPSAAAVRGPDLGQRTDVVVVVGPDAAVGVADDGALLGGIVFQEDFEKGS